MGNPENPADWRGRDLLDRDMINGHTLEVADIDGDGNLDIFSAEMTDDQGYGDFSLHGNSHTCGVGR